MIERVVAELAMPYREPFCVRAFSFGAAADGRPLDSEGQLAEFDPAAFLVGGLRGDEVQQAFICSRLVARLAQMEQAGDIKPKRLITVVPCANTASMGIGWRFWPGDKTDVNRMFPGYDQGETTQRIAAALFEASRGYRFGVHFGSFYLQGDFASHVRVMHVPGRAADNGADFGLPYVLHHVPGSFDTTTLHYNWRLWDTEAYTLYTKETALVDERSADEAVRAALRFMAARDIVSYRDADGQPDTPGTSDTPCASDKPGTSDTIQLSESSLVAVQTRLGGFFCPRVAVGDSVCAGDVLADIDDLMRGTCRETLVAPCDGAVFYTARTPLVNEETLAFQIVPSDLDASADADDRGNFLDPEA